MLQSYSFIVILGASCSCQLQSKSWHLVYILVPTDSDHLSCWITPGLEGTKGQSQSICGVVGVVGVVHGKTRLNFCDGVGYLLIICDSFIMEVDAVVYLVDAYDKERFAESKKELDALLSDESLATVPFLILGNKIDITDAASEDELRYHMGLTNFTTGKGKVNLNDSNVRPLEVFMCSIVRKMGYGEGFKWLSQYIK